MITIREQHAVLQTNNGCERWVLKQLEPRIGSLGRGKKKLAVRQLEDYLVRLYPPFHGSLIRKVEQCRPEPALARHGLANRWLYFRDHMQLMNDQIHRIDLEKVDNVRRPAVLLAELLNRLVIRGVQSVPNRLLTGLNRRKGLDLAPRRFPQLYGFIAA